MRRRFTGPANLYNLCFHVVLSEITPGDNRELGCDFLASQLFYRSDCGIFAYCKHELCLPDLDIEELFHIGYTFDHHIVAGDPDIRCTGGDIFRDIDGAGKQDLNMGVESPGDEPAFAGFRQVEAALLDQIENRFGYPSLIGDSKTYDIGKRGRS